MVTVKHIVNNVKLPSTNVYYEKDSIDGYAYLGIARELLGLNTDHLYDIIKSKPYGLCSIYTIRDTTLPSDTIYTYSCYSVFEYYYLIKNWERLSNIIYFIDKRIGTYKDTGLMRYCNIETNYRVPNVTPLAGLMHLKYGDNEDKVITLLESFEKQQEINGNWRYYYNGKPQRQEDSMHLAMIVNALREIYRIRPLDCVKRMINRSLPCLYQMNKLEIQSGSIGWNPPFLALAIHNRKKYSALYKNTVNKVKTESINNSNFRVRAISAWALAKLYVRHNTSNNLKPDTGK